MPKVSTSKGMASKPSSSVNKTEENGHLSDYELKRLKRIEENKAILRSLNIIQAKEELHQLQKPKTRTNPTSRSLKPKVTTPLPSRRSLRLQERICEDNTSLDHTGPYQLRNRDEVQYIEEHPGKPDGPLDTTCVNDVELEIEHVFRKTFLSSLENSSCTGDQALGSCSTDMELCSLSLSNSQIAKVTKDRIFSLAIAPVTDKVLAIAGDKWGKIGIWDSEDTCSDHLGVYLYEPHSRPVSAIVFDKSDGFFSTSYDGSLRACNLEKGAFELVMKMQDECLTACEIRDHMLLVGAANGSIIPVDYRQSNAMVQQWKGISSKTIKCISVNPVNDNYFAASSSDATVGIWDIRNLRTTGSPRALVQKIPLSRTVTSAFYDPSNGTKLLTTSMDDHIRVYHSDTPGGHLQVLHHWYHNNHVGRWLTNFQATWDPKCEHRFVCGSMSYPRQVELYSIKNNERSRFDLTDALQSSICSLVKFHPKRNILVGANSSGKVFIWK